MKSLQGTFLYQHLNKSNGLTQNIGSLLTDGITLTRKELEEPFLIIMKNFKFPLKHKIFEAFDSGQIVLKFATGNSKLPTCLPFILHKANNGIVAVVSVDIYGTLDKETDSVKIDPKKLYCMMEGAYLARLEYLYSSQLTQKAPIITNGSAIYSMMFTRVLNKKYALNVDKNKFNKVMFLSSKFFMMNVLGMKDGETVVNYALRNCPNGNLLILQEVNDMFKTEVYASLETFIQALADPTNGLNLKDLTVRGYLEAFINMYDSSMLLSLEAFPYFVYNVLSVTNGAYINNQYVLEDIVDSHGAKLYTALLTLDK